MRTRKFLTAVTCLWAIAITARGQDDVAKWTNQLDASDVATRLAASRELAKLGTEAQAAVPRLTKALKAREVEEQRLAALALASIGEFAAAAVPALTDRLTAEDAQVRAAAAYALGQIGPAARGATEALVKAFVDTDPAVRRHVRDALRQIDPPRDVVLPLFVQALESADPADAAAAVHTLVEAGAQAVPGLVRALDTPDAAYWACLALSELGPQAAPAVPALGKLLSSEEMETRMQALVALAAIGAPSRTLVKEISVLANQDESGAVRYAALYALGAIGDPAIAMPALVEAMNSEDEFARTMAAWACVRMADGEGSPAVEKAVGIVVAGVTSADPRVREVAVRAIADSDVPADMGRAALRDALLGINDHEKLMDVVDALASLRGRSVPICIQSLETKGPLRFYALQLLIKLGPDAAPAREALVKTLDDPQPELRREALFALGAIGAEAAPAVDHIAAKLADEDADVRHTACYALGKIGPAAAAALPKLLAALDSDDKFLQIAAAWAALKIAPQDEILRTRVAPYFVTALQDEREHIRIEAAHVLGEFGQATAEALAALQQAQQQDDSRDVRAAAAAALEQLRK